jgi:hypothetical protein
MGKDLGNPGVQFLLQKGKLKTREEKGLTQDCTEVKSQLT